METTQEQPESAGAVALHPLVMRVRREVRKNRSYHIEADLETWEVRIVAEKAGVDWLHKSSTGEVQFFEFAERKAHRHGRSGASELTNSHRPPVFGAAHG